MIIITFFSIGGKLDVPVEDDKVKNIIEKIRQSENPIVDITEFCKLKELPVIINKVNLCFVIGSKKSEIATPEKQIKVPGKYGIN